MIITSQVHEIDEMKASILDIDAKGERGSQVLPAVEPNITCEKRSKIEAAVR